MLKLRLIATDEVQKENPLADVEVRINHLNYELLAQKAVNYSVVEKAKEINSQLEQISAESDKTDDLIKQKNFYDKVITLGNMPADAVKALLETFPDKVKEELIVSGAEMFTKTILENINSKASVYGIKAEKLEITREDSK